MNDTIFTDYGTVKFPDFYRVFLEEETLEKYLKSLSNIVDSNYKYYLEYDKEDNKLYVNYHGERSELVLNNDLKKEFDNNSDTVFNNKIRELLKRSELKEKYYSIDDKGTFNSIEEADDYIKYLERLEDKKDILPTQEVRLSGAREYIKKKADKNSDIYKYHVNKEREITRKINEQQARELNSKKRYHENEIKSYTIFNIICKVLFAITIIVPISVVLAVAIYTTASLINIVFLFGALTFIQYLIDKFLIVELIKDSNITISDNKDDLEEINSKLNKLNNELVKTKEEIKTNSIVEEKKHEETNTIVEEKKQETVIDNKGNLNKGILQVSDEISKTLEQNQLLNNEEIAFYAKKAIAIMKDYREKLEAGKDNKENIELTTDDEYSLKIKTYLKMQKLKQEIDAKIKMKEELNVFDQEIDNFNIFVDQSTNNNQTLTRKI